MSNMVANGCRKSNGVATAAGVHASCAGIRETRPRTNASTGSPAWPGLLRSPGKFIPLINYWKSEIPCVPLKANVYNQVLLYGK